MSVQCTLSEAQVQEAFLAAPPLINQQIIDLSLKHPSWLRDLPEVEEWPRGNGTLMEQLIFRSALPQIERGFDKWKKLSNNTGCSPCSGPDCAYNWTQLGGHGFERKITELMRREFRSPAYCISEIQTTAHFRDVFAKIVESLYAQIDFIKEQNIALNALTGLAKKYVVDSGGIKPNTQNPYVYRNIGSARLSQLNIGILEFFYEQMRRMPDAIPYDVVDGSPIFALEASAQLLSHLYRDDSELRQDVRFSGLANANLLKYNFMTTIRGMFIPAPMLYPRRFNIVSGEPIEVLPFINDIPAEVGTYTGINGAYETATHEEVTIHGKYPFKVFYMPTEQTLGQNTSFGPEFSWFNNWLWVNPLTNQDPFRRVGYFATSAQFGISQQFSDAIYGILVERPSVASVATFFPTPACPPTPVDCDNEVPAVGCPCPLILDYSQNPVDLTHFFLNLAAPLPSDTVEDDTIQFGLDTGGYIVGTVVAISADFKSVEVTFPAGTTLGTCDRFTTIFCDNTLGCSSAIAAYVPNCADATRVDLTLENPIKADTAADVVTLYYGNGTTQSGTVVTANMLTNVWVVDIGGTNFCDQVGGIISICVPPGTDATCPACGAGPTITQCS